MANHWRVISLVSIWHVAASICYYTAYVAPPFFRETYAINRSAIGILLGILALGYVSSLLPFGAIVDSIGEKHTLTIGLIGLSLAVGSLLFAPTYVALLGVVFILGVFYGTATPGTNKAIFSKVPQARRNLGMGIKQLGNIMGTGLSAILLTSIATTQYGWRGGFVTVTLLGILTAGFFFVRYESPTTERQPLQLPNIRQLLANQPYRRLTLAGFFLGTTTYTTIGYTILYITESIGIAIGLAGIILGATQFAGGAGRVLSGWLGDRLPGHPQQRTLGILLGQITIGTTLLLLVPSFSTPIITFIGFAGVGFFILGLTGMYFSSIGTLVPIDDSGSASAVGQLTFTAGGLVAPPAFGYLVDTSSYTSAWMLLVIFGTLAALIIITILTTLPTTIDPTSP